MATLIFGMASHGEKDSFPNFRMKTKNKFELKNFDTFSFKIDTLKWASSKTHDLRRTAILRMIKLLEVFLLHTAVQYLGYDIRSVHCHKRQKCTYKALHIFSCLICFVSMQCHTRLWWTEVVNKTKLITKLISCAIIISYVIVLLPLARRNLKKQKGGYKVLCM